MAISYQKRKGRWTATVRKDGVSTSKTFGLKEHAKKWGEGVERQIESGEWFEDQSYKTTTLDAALGRYLKEITAHKGGSKQEENRIKAWRKHPLAKRRMFDLKTADFVKHRDARVAEGRASSTIRNELNLISNLYRIAATEWGYEGLRNPLDKVRKTRPEGMPEGRDRRLRDGEEKKILDKAEYPLKELFVLAIDTCMRQNELLDLKREWIGKDHIIRIPPSPDERRKKRRREIPLTLRARAILKKLPRRLDGKVFDWDQDKLEYQWRKFKEREDVNIVDLRWHDLRHEGTSRLFEKGFQIHEAQRVTGHKTLEMLLRYTHIRTQDLLKKIG